MSDHEPRRWKLPSERTDTEREAAGRLGADGRTERDEYRQWRAAVLRDERDDLPLRLRLLEEQAEVLRTRAGVQRTDALEALTPDDWFAREQAKNAGQPLEPLDDGGAADLEAQADDLEAEAQEIAQHLAETREAA